MSRIFKLLAVVAVWVVVCGVPAGGSALGQLMVRPPAPPKPEQAGSPTAPRDQGTLGEAPADPGPEEPLPEPLEFVGNLPVTRAGMALRTVIGLVNGQEIEEPADVFSAEFLSRVDATRLNAVMDEVRASMSGGSTLVRVEPGFGMDRIVGVLRAQEPADQEERNAFRVFLTTDRESGRIRTLFFQPAWHERLRPADWSALDRRLEMLPGRAALGAYEVLPDTGDRLKPVPIHTRGSEALLPVSDASRLFVSATVTNFVARSHRLEWSEALAVQNRLKSLPPGRTRDETEGTTLTLEELVGRSLVGRDNSATEHLMDFVSRVGVENYARPLLGLPETSLPFLSTLEVFKLKLGEDETLAGRFARMDPPAKLAALEDGGEVFRAVPNEGRFKTWEGPISVNEAGWFVSADDMARLMSDVARLTDGPDGAPLWAGLAGAEGPPLDHRVWTKVGFVGGSEPGVLSLNWLLTRADGRRFVLVLAWADAEARLPEGLGFMAAGAAARLLGAHEFSPPGAGGEGHGGR